MIQNIRPRSLRSKVAISVALAIAAAAAQAQTTTGTIAGEVPDAAGKSVVVESNTGLKREVAVGADGRYVIPNLPIGTYKVTVQENGSTVDTRENVAISIGATTSVSFTEQVLDTALVSATSSRAIDVSTTDTRTIITAEELAILPLGRTAEAIAQLAPGVVANSGAYLGPTGTPLVSFGGSAATENAYYLNGVATTDPFRNMGGLGLPYGAIDQQEVFSGGYGAQYGRSNGGVMNQVGKRGTNEWEFGVGAIFELDATRAKAKDLTYAITTTNSGAFNRQAGDLYRPNGDNKADLYTYNAYVGGPIIKDRLFFFLAGEKGRTYGERANSRDDTTFPFVRYTYDDTRYYAKLDWQITDSHLLELTTASDEREITGTYWNYAFNTSSKDSGPTTFRANDTVKKRGNTLYTGKYTGYLTEDVTFTAIYGYQEAPNRVAPESYDPTYSIVNSINAQDPSIVGSTRRSNPQALASITDPDRRTEKTNLRANINWRLGSHSLEFGIDNQKVKSLDQGSYTTGPTHSDGRGGISWTYGFIADISRPLSTAPTLTNINNAVYLPPGSNGYYVSQGRGYSVYGSVANQTAQYIEDKWNVSDNFLLSLGLRVDQFKNGIAGEPYHVKVDNAWAPRVGFSWDVNGNSTFKVFGNAGRYYLGLPVSSNGLTAPSLSTTQYFTYTGIDANGYPTGLTPLGDPVAANSSFGLPHDPRAGAAADLKGEGQDEFILGMNKALDFAGQSWVIGLRLVYRDLISSVDDTNFDTQPIQDAAAAAGFVIDSATGNNTPGILINPGETNTLNLYGTDGQWHQVTLTREDWGFPKLKRVYKAAEFVLEKPLRDKWYAKFNYVLSRSSGTTEGQLRSDLYRAGDEAGVQQGQVSVSTTQSWDDPALMEHFDGVQSNDHTHQLKGYGYYQLTDEWGVSANFSAVSGAPKAILGYYYGTQFGPSTDPAGYGGAYHFNGYTREPAPPGSAGRMPWTYQLDLGASYKPRFFDNKLSVNVNVFNVLNAQKATYLFPRTERNAGTFHELYNTPMYRQTPRYARLSVNYDF